MNFHVIQSLSQLISDSLNSRLNGNGTTLIAQAINTYKTL